MIPPLPGGAMVPRGALTPDGPEGREWILRELQKPEYAAAQPRLMDRIAAAIMEWFERLLTPGGSVPSDWIPVILIVLAVGGAAVALIVWGRPRLSGRRPAHGDALFAERDRRTAAALRRDSDRAAASGDYALATTERFRALCRSLEERTVVTLLPGSTAQEVAGRAGRAFPDSGPELAAAAAAFDAVRYLDQPGTEAAWGRVRDLDRRLAEETPALEEISLLHATPTGGPR